MRASNLNNYGQILRPSESLGTLISNGRKPLEIVNTQAGKIPARDLQEKDQWQSGFMLFRDVWPFWGRLTYGEDWYWW
jgi:hypothetical protein